MGLHFERGSVLFEQSRYDLAETELRAEIAEDLGSAPARALLALCLSRTDRDREAESEARLAVSSAPDMPFVHYVLASVLHGADRSADAEISAREAVRLDPEDATYRGQLAAILLDSGRPEDALLSAEEGLSIDPDDALCANVRGMALVRLGRSSEAAAGLDGALEKDPEDPLTHANQGWTLLHAGERAEAEEHFRESLRLDPMNEWAREGMLEALKARNSIYAVMLRYFLWMSRQSSKAQIGILLGGYIAVRIARGIAKSNPSLSPLIIPMVVAYALFAYMTWVAEPLFNLVLLSDRHGRHVLSRSDRTGALVFGSFLALALAAGAASLAAVGSGAPFRAFFSFTVFFSLAALMSALTMKCPAGWRRAAMGAFGGVTAISALLGGLARDFGPAQIRVDEVERLLVIVSIGGFILSSWVANALILSGNRR